MSVGLYDADMMAYTHTAPNLELMKYATYYKNRGEVTTISPHLNPSFFKTFIYRKDYDDGDFPNLSKYNNVIYGGLGYSNNQYVPLPQEIEELVPDTTIYNKMKPIFGNNLTNERIFNTCLNCRHLRLSLDGKTVWPDFLKQIDESRINNYFFHDYDLNKIEGSTDAIKLLLNTGRVRRGVNLISNKFPIKVYNEEDLEKWAHFLVSSDFFNLNYYGLMSTEYFKYFIRTSTLQNSGKSIQYIVTYGFKDQQDFVDNGIETMYDQFIIACTNHKKISLIYDDDFFIDDIWKDFFLLLELFNSSICQMSKQNFLDRREGNSLYQFAKNLKKYPRHIKNITIEQARKIFAHIRVTNYNLFKKLYESNLIDK